jgi:hypothetical protein
MLGWMAWTWPTALFVRRHLQRNRVPDGARAEIPRWCGTRRHSSPDHDPRRSPLHHAARNGLYLPGLAGSGRHAAVVAAGDQHWLGFLLLLEGLVPAGRKD